MAANNAACYYPPVTPNFRSRPSTASTGLSKRRQTQIFPPEVRTSAMILTSPEDHGSGADPATSGSPSSGGELSAILDAFAFFDDAFHDADYSPSNLTDSPCVSLPSRNTLPVNGIPFQTSPVFSVLALSSPPSAPQSQVVPSNTSPITDATLPCISSKSCQCTDIIATALGAEDGGDAQDGDSGDDEHDDDALFRRLARIRHNIEILRRLIGCSDCLSSRKSVMLLLVIVGRLVRRFQRLIQKSDSRATSCPAWRGRITIRVGSCFEASSPDEVAAIFNTLLRMHLQGMLDVLSRLGLAIHDNGWTAQTDGLSAASIALIRLETRLRPEV